MQIEIRNVTVNTLQDCAVLAQRIWQLGPGQPVWGRRLCVLRAAHSAAPLGAAQGAQDRQARAPPAGLTADRATRRPHRVDPDKREGQQLLLLRGQGHGTAGTVQGDWGESRLYSDILLMRLVGTVSIG